MTWQRRLLLFSAFPLIALAVTEVALRAFGSPDHSRRFRTTASGTLRILCAGDPQAAPHYPYFLDIILRQKGISATITDRRIWHASSGAVVSLLENWLTDEPYDLLLVTLGGTDRQILLPDKKRGNTLVSLRIVNLLRRMGSRLFTVHPRKKTAETGRVREYANERMLGRWYRRRGEPDRSAEEFRKSIEENPKNTEAVLGLGWHHMAHGEFDKCERVFLDALRNDPDNCRLYIELSWAYTHKDEHAKAAALRERIKRMRPRINHDLEPAQQLVEKGRWAMLKAEYGRALALFRKAAALDPVAIGAYFGLGWWQMAEGDFDAAEKTIAEAALLDPGDWPQVELGRCYSYQGKLNEAIETFGKCLLVNPRNDAALVGLAGCYSSLGEQEKAAAAYRKVLELTPNSFAALMGLGRYAIARGNKDEATAMFERARRINPREEDAYIEQAQLESFACAPLAGSVRFFLRKGQWYLARGEHEQAKTAFLEAAEIRPEEARAYAGLGRCAAARGEYTEALELFSKAVELGPHEEVFELYRAYCYLCLGDTVASEGSFRKASALRRAFYNPLTRRSHERLKRVTGEKGIHLICVDYPLRNPTFHAAAKDKKEPLTLSRGMYGECTEEGSRLLAEGIADTIERLTRK